jgi:hypothetical protein
MTKTIRARNESHPVGSDAAFANIGEGLSDDAAEELTEDGWIIGEHDYCPDHADAHRDNEGTDEVKP